MPYKGIKNRNANANSGIDKRNWLQKWEIQLEKKKTKVFEDNTMYESTIGKFSSVALLQIR